MQIFKQTVVNSVLFVSLLFCLMACSTTGYADEPETTDIDTRIVALGDIHGDFDQMVAALRMAGLINKKNRWIGGATHLVQLGDIPDRGPDTRKAMDLLIKLQVEAKKSGGEVTSLIGNHEAMMMIGDLRYVHPGEYAAFKTRNSRAVRNAYYQQTVAHLTATLEPQELPVFDKDYKQAWEQKFPLGYVEHRQAWAPTGEYGKWVLSRPAAVKIGSTLFVHGGISPSFAKMSLSDINTRVRTALAEAPQIKENSIIEVEDGPLWDRGWVRRLQNEENTKVLNEVLEDFQVKRMVVAHTPLAPIIVPRFGGKVLMADVGLSAHYGGNSALLEIIGNEVYMILDQRKLAIPQREEDFEAYFDAAEKLVLEPQKITRYREAIKQAQIDDKAAKAAQN